MCLTCKVGPFPPPERNFKLRHDLTESSTELQCFRSPGSDAASEVASCEF